LEAEKTQRQLVRHLLNSAFGGSPARLVVQALSEESASSKELKEIQKLIRELERREGKS
jgi:predicted transcriptional regulator